MSRRSAMSARRSLWCVALIGLVAPLLPISALGAAEGDSVGADGSAADAEAQNDTMPDDSAGGVEVVRYAGSDQYETSIEVAQALVDPEGGSSEQVVLASGESWADAAMAGPLAASLGAPVVLVPPGGLQTAAARSDLVEFLRSTGVRRVVIVGSPDVLPNHEPSVLYGLGMLPRNLERVHGDDSVGASVAVAERIGAPAAFGELGRTVVIASDQSIADAVAVGPLATSGPFPLLLTPPNQLDPRVAAYLAEQQIEHVVLVGGTAAIAPAVREAIEAAGAAVTRLEGEDRYHTAALAMDLLAQAPGCVSNAIDSIGLALGGEPQLALTAGRLLGPRCIPLLFTEAGRLAPVTQNYLYLYRHRTGIEPSWHLIGDDVTIDPSVIERPPVRMATVADNPDGDGQHIVVLDEHHQARHYLTDAGFDAITYVQWSSNRSVIGFGAIRDGELAAYRLDTRSGIATPRPPRSPVWYAHLAQDGWVDPRPSPDQDYVVFRAPADAGPGHLLLAVNVVSGAVQRITDDRTGNVHHIVSSRWSRNANWLPDGRRLIYASQDAVQSESHCSDVPMSLAHIVDVETGAGHRLEFDGYAIGDALLLSPDGSHLVVQSYPSYELAPAQDGWSFWTFDCVYFGTGTPVLTVFDLSGPQPLRIAGPDLVGRDPKWSPDGRRLVFRAPSEPNKGHSLFVVDVETNSISKLTNNESDDVHHVVLRWLAGDGRLIYSVMRIEELEGECGGWPHAQVQRSHVPHAQLHIAEVGGGQSTKLPYSGFVIGLRRDGDLDFSPDGRYLAAVSYPSYWLSQIQGGCPYVSEGIPRLHIYDLSALTPEVVVVHESHGHGGTWSPDGQYVAYYQGEPRDDGSLDSKPTIRDMRDGSKWTLELPGTRNDGAWVSFGRWSPDGSRILIRFHRSDNRIYYDNFEFVAVPESELLIRLSFPQDEPRGLTFGSYSADRQQILRAQESFYSNDIGTLYVNDVAHDGSLLGTFRTFAATEPSSATLIERQAHLDSDSAYDEYFDMISIWTPEGIFAASYFSWQPYSH